MSNEKDIYIDKRSHHFKVYNFSHFGKRIIEEYAKKLIHWGYIRQGRQFRRAPLKVFAASNFNRDEYRFHIHSFDDFIRFIKERGISESRTVITEAPLREVQLFDLPIKEGWVPRENQEPAIDYITTDDGPRQRLVQLYTGAGKAQPLDAGIYTPQGWCSMGEMYIGKEIYTQSGAITEVAGIFPQGRIDIYRITFQDGRTTECCSDHLWKVYNGQWNERNRERVIDTKTISKLLEHKSFEKRLYVPLIEHPIVEDKTYIIHPYVMGVLLGDGSFGENQISLTNSSNFIYNKVKKLIPKDIIICLQKSKTKVDYNFVLNKELYQELTYHTDSSFYHAFKRYDLIGKKAPGKFIPEDYINTSKKQKIELLNGLLDTDGYVGINGSIEYSTVSLKLALQVQYLVRSIGGLCKLTERQTYYTHEKIRKPGLPSYRLTIRYNNPIDLLTLPRKKERIPKKYQYKNKIRLRIEKIEYVGKKYAQCITVKDESRLYITDDFVVTHNSFLSMFANSRMRNRFILIARPMFLDKWVLDIKKTYDIPDDDILVIRGGASLMGLVEKAKNDQLDARVILMSNKTLQIYINNYERFGNGIKDMGYDDIPDNLFQILGGGLRVIDEVHLDYHANFKLDLYTNTNRAVALTATLLTDDHFIRSMHELGYPLNQRFEGAQYQPYINSIALMYQFERSDKIRYLDVSGKTYSHHVFEQSIIRQSHVLKHYMEMIYKTINTYFIGREDKKPDDKFIVFCSSIDLCTRVTEFLQEKFLDLDIRRYVEDDPYENLIEPIGRVSTLLSAGTAVDIDQLTTTILTTAVNSSPSNVQGFGRLRQLKDGRSPLFIYFNDMNNPKHLDYHDKKREIIKPRSLNFKEVHYGSLI